MYCERCGNQLVSGGLFCSSCGASVKPGERAIPPPLPPPIPQRRITESSRKGKTLGAILAIVAVGFFGLVLIIGIIAAIAIPNLLNAIQRGKQVRTMADMRTIGAAIEAYDEDNNALPAVESMSKLSGILSPKYIGKLPIHDAWQQEFRYVVSDPASETRRYIIVSSGKDGILEHEDPQLYTPTPVQSFNNDLVFSGGEFIRYPEGRTP